MSESMISDRPSRQLPDDQQPIRHVAVCLDRSPVGDSVMAHGVAIAAAFGAKITVLHALEPPHAGSAVTVTDPVSWEAERAEAQTHLDEIRLEYTTVDLSTEAEVPAIGTEVLEGRPAEVIRDWVAGHGVDLTVLSSHGASGPTEWTLASTARKLIEGVSGSVLLIPTRPTPPPPKAEAGYDRVLLLLDGSTRAECALAIASHLTETQDAELVLLHVVPQPDASCPSPFDEDENDLDQRLVDRNVRAAQAYLERVGRRVAVGHPRVRSNVTVGGDVRDEIQRRIVDDHIDLVVLSGHGHSGRAEVPVGSVAGFLLEHATVPLLLVRDQTECVQLGDGERRTQHGGRLPQIADT